MRAALVLVLVLGCGASKKQYQPGDNPGCSVASCCSGGFFFDGTSCRQMAPPYCGCDCRGPTPPTYPTEQECIAEHGPKP